MQGIQSREISRLNRSRIFGISRNIFLKIGTKLVKNGQIDCVRDVFYLHIDELLNETDMRDIIKNRKMEEEMFKFVPSYSRLVFSEMIFDKRGIRAQSNILNKKDKFKQYYSDQFYTFNFFSKKTKWDFIFRVDGVYQNVHLTYIFPKS